ncbi:uncharacterized protein LOC121387745 [Gigantopelta aegis]|uniref:uncharacterized protein LOC121387745 n=1 Tax=Gigantopelta aegis TaxID=1735272 RepID=UPI001B88E6B5|nr:uncharacterized protein LOC121387745 [Gigantopelta aegis]
MLTLTLLLMLFSQLSAYEGEINLNEIQDQSLADELAEFDFDNDGILNAEEIQLSFTSIKYIISEHKEKKDGKTEQKETEAVVEEDEDETETVNGTNTVLLTAVIGAIVTCLFILVWTKASRKQEHNTNELMRTKREEWLAQFSGSNQTKQRKHLVDDTAEEPALIAAKLRKTTFENSYEKSLPSACKQRKTTFETLGKHEKLYESDSSQNDEDLGDLPHKDTGHVLKEVANKPVPKKVSKLTQTKHSHFGGSRHLKSSDSSGFKSRDAQLQGGRENGCFDKKVKADFQNKKDKLKKEEEKKKDFEPLKGKSFRSDDEGVDTTSHVAEELSSSETSANEVSSSTSLTETPANEMSYKTSLVEEVKKKTTDSNKLIAFLSQVLDCQLHVGEEVKSRYSLGKLDINSSDLPIEVTEIPGKLEKILQKIVPRQVNQIKYAVWCFGCCEDFENSYHDNLVNAASVWLKTASLTTIFKNLNIESETHSVDEDLWSDFENKDSVSDCVKFLWRLTGWADDNVVISSSLLSRLLDCGEQSVALVTNLFKAAGTQLNSVKRIDEVIFKEGRTLKALEILISNPKSGPVLAVALEKEVSSASEGLGNIFENNSIFGPLLGVSTVPTKLLKGRTLILSGSIVSPFMSLRGFPRVTEADLRQVESAIQEGMSRCQAVVYSALKTVMTSKATREQALSWLSAVICLNDLRSPGILETDTQLQACCSDGFMLNFCSCLLDFFTPIFADSTKLKKIDLGYSTSEACRLNYDFETCLASAQIISEKEKRLGPLPDKLQSVHSFITECYHLTQRALSIGVIPAVSHYNRMLREFSLKIQSLKGTPQEEKLKNQHVLMTVMWETSLVDPELVRKVSMFYLAQATLLLTLLEEAGQNATDQEEKLKLERKAFSKIPEFCIKDMAIWFRFAASHALYVHKEALRGLSLSPLVDCCVLLLERPDLMPGPIPASKIVSTLYHFVQTSENPSVRGPGWGSGVMSELAAIVHTCPLVKSNLGPALLRVYISVDVVEGLDVDKDEFDKYSARSEMGKLIEHLWHRSDCRASIAALCHTELFQNFLGAILDTLLYMLHDSLSRLANIRKIEITKENHNVWNSLSATQRMDKENFLKNEEHVAKGFMSLANETLSFIDLLTNADEVSRCFTEQPLAQRSASVICGFLESLCGTKAKDFKVKDMDKYNFSPKKLLSHIVEIILRISVQEKSRKDGYLFSMVTDVDFEIGNLEKALTVLSSQGLTDVDTVQQLSDLIKQLRVLQSECATDKNQSGSQLESDWLTKVAAMETNHEALATEYTGSMTAYRLGAANILEAHSYYGNIQELDPRSSKVKTLMKEMKQLQQNLPVHPDAAIFIRQDEDRMDIMRAVVTGPVGTPYSLGCFVFDVYFPTSYPNIPPLIKLITTGNGTVRFNPNLYSDGKVCLSLLGTWHGGNASEKWNPGKSTLYQVLLSIQSIILVPDPVFNEPGYEGRQETPEGKQQSDQYNWKIRLLTMRHAILGVLCNPPTGMADIVRRHFSLQKEAILKQCYQWLQECEDEDLQKRFRQALQSLYTQLNSIPGSDEESDGSHSVDNH